MSIDTNFYPLGSCTMKYNPKRHERLAGLPGFANLHPLQDDEHHVRACWTCLYGMQEYLTEISGLPRSAATRRRGAGRTDRAVRRRAYFRTKGESTHRRKVLVPDSAHGTNPASAALAGFEAPSP